MDWGWTFAPGVLLALIGYGIVYGLRWRRVRQSEKDGGPKAAPIGRLLLFIGGLVTVLIALVSPVGRAGEQLATAHMVQHLLLADIAPILFIVAFTRILLRPATRRVHRIEEALGPFAHPVFGVVAYVGVMWLWHIPALYDAALENSFLHVLEHVTFALAGGLYWWHLLSPIRSRFRLAGLGPILYMASTKILVGIVGIVLAFAPDLIYDAYGTTGERIGLTPLDDLHVAGLLMALEQSIVMGIALAWLFARMLAESEREEQRRERYEEAAV